MYDERTMEKDKDALCRLRLNHHIKNNQRCRQEKRNSPHVYISIRDNCVGQNKSNVTMQFDCWMSLSFYKRVMIIFLIPGHSHMVADRVVAWVKRSLNHKDLYVPNEIKNCMNKVKSVKAEFISHNNDTRPCFTKFSEFLGQHLKKMPSGFTSNYVFEFFNSNVTMKHLISNN